MKKFLLSIALVLFAGATMAQSTLEFTFNRSAKTVTAKLDGEVKEGITATIAISPNTYLTTNNCANDSILAINRNTNAATADDPNCYTLAISGLGNCTFDGITVGGVAVSSTGQFQGMDTNRDRNFVIGYGADANNLTNTNPLTKRICDNAHCNGTPTDHTFTVEGTSNGNLVIKVQIYTDGGAGCFYGLTSISLNNLIIIPEPEPEPTPKFYTINLTPLYTNSDRTGASMYVHSDARLRCNRIAGELDAKNVFAFVTAADGKTYMKNIATQTYISRIGATASQDAIYADSEAIENAMSVTFGVLGEATVGNNTVEIIEIQPGNNPMLNCAEVDGSNNNSGRVVSFTPGSDKISKASAWYLTEVTEFSHTLNVGTSEWATLVLGFNATIPTNEGFKAYTIKEIDGESIKLIEATGVLSANTPIIINAPQGDYTFEYTTEVATVTANGKLKGTLYDKNVTEDAYVLTADADGVCFGIATKNQADNTAFKNNANKAYLPTSALTGASLSANLRFDFDGTTAIEEVETENAETVIYDLTGRRVNEITKVGVYIVNGKKILVK